MHLWASIKDTKELTLEDYQKIEAYLKTGKRTYLNKISDLTRLSHIRNFELVGPNQEQPIFETYSFNVDENTNQRCILLYASRNGIYPDKVLKQLTELMLCGYSGHVLLRIGAFPNIANGGIHLCHIPYAFKVAFLKEAEHLGFKEVLWIDTSLHPLTNLEAIFSAIHEKGHFFTTVGMLSDNQTTHLPEAALSLGVTVDQYSQIPHLSSSMIGLNLNAPLPLQLLNEWYFAAKSVYPFLTCWPEELSLSIFAFRLGLEPDSWLGNRVCGEGELHLPSVRKRPLQFYIDAIRDY
ncbi:MAG TPA: hypothetical protein VLE96_00010 [Chlamydiales bacterium]|nr:hypothetical protein [Chlamydiales bacterium]